MLLLVVVRSGWLVGEAPAAARDYYVATNAVASGAPWDRWSVAFTNIQDALDAAEPGDTIYLAGHAFPLTNQLTWAAGKGDLLMIGGFAATNDVDQPGTPDPDRWPTVVRRSLATRFRILDLIGVTNGIIRNVILAGGYPADGQHGGGVRITDSSMTLDGCSILDNQVYIYSGSIHGGGLYAVNSSVLITNGWIANNRSFNGYGATSQLSHGGGLFFSGGDSMLIHTVVRANRAQKTSHEAYLNRGGGVAYQLGSHRIHNCAIAGNVASGAGSAIWVNHAATVLVVGNTTFAGNTGGKALHVTSGTVAVTNSIFWDNEGDIGGGGTVTLAYCNTEDGTDAGNNGNRSGDPLFDRGLYLGSGSASIDAGTGTASDWGLDGLTTRADGAPDGGVVDQGYHYPHGLDWGVADFYVASTGDDGGSGTNWSEAFRSISHALSRARDGTRIHIAAGVYTNDVSGGEQFPLVVFDRWGLQLLGAGASNTVLRVERGVRQRLLNTALTAGDTLISGLTLTKGAPAHGLFGGGAEILYGVMRLDDCALVDNESIVNGWSIYAGGIYMREARVSMSRCRFDNNRARNIYGAAGGVSYGGAIFSLRGQSSIENAVLVANRSFSTWNYPNQASYGGALFYSGGRHQVTGSLIVSNEATGVGSAIYVQSGDVALRNLTVADNIRHPALRGLAGVGVTNCIFWNHAGGDFDNIAPESFQFSCATGLTAGVQGNITADPMFVGNGDYRLRVKVSPAVDAGINQDWMPPATDLAGMPRILHGRASKTVDMGAYEAVPPPGTLLQVR